MRFFLNLAGAVYDSDNRGDELPDIQAARIYAVTHAVEVIKGRSELAWAGDEVRVEVTDENQLALVTVIVIGVESAAGQGH